MSFDEETGYGSIEITPKVESTTSRRRVAVVAALALFGLVVIGGSSQAMRMSFWDGEGGDDHLYLKRTRTDDCVWGKWCKFEQADDDDDDESDFDDAAGAKPWTLNDDFTPEDDDPTQQKNSGTVSNAASG